MIDKLKEIDYRICRLERQINFYSLFNPVNRNEEKNKFFRYLKNRKIYNPKFKYKIKNS